MSSKVNPILIKLHKILSKICQITSKTGRIESNTTGLNISDKLCYLHFDSINAQCAWVKCASAIITLSNMMDLGSNPLPGRTCRRELRISSPLEFSWWPNWFVGNAKTT